MESCNLYPSEGSPRKELGDYNFYKASEELRSNYRSPKISNKDVLINWKDYKAVYRNVLHQIPTNQFPNPMKEGVYVEVEVVTGKLSLIRLVTTKSKFIKEEHTHIIMDQNATIYKEGRGGGR